MRSPVHVRRLSCAPPLLRTREADVDVESVVLVVGSIELELEVEPPTPLRLPVVRATAAALPVVSARAVLPDEEGRVRWPAASSPSAGLCAPSHCTPAAATCTATPRPAPDRERSSASIKTASECHRSRQHMCGSFLWSTTSTTTPPAQPTRRTKTWQKQASRKKRRRPVFLCKLAAIGHLPYWKHPVACLFLLFRVARFGGLML